MAPRVKPEAFWRQTSTVTDEVTREAAHYAASSYRSTCCTLFGGGPGLRAGRRRGKRSGSGDLAPDGSNNPRFAGDEPLIKSLRRKAQTSFYPRLRPEELLLPMMKKEKKKGRKAFRCSTSHSLSQRPNGWTLVTRQLIINGPTPASWYPGLP